jgi:hypothetical protein
VAAVAQPYRGGPRAGHQRPAGAHRQRAVSEYIRFEHAITFMNVAAGEEVRWLSRRQASSLLLPGNDFWAFDDRLVRWNHFTGEGEVSPDDRELADDPEIAKTCAAAFGAVWDRAIPHGEYSPLDLVLHRLHALARSQWARRVLACRWVDGATVGSTGGSPGP